MDCASVRRPTGIRDGVSPRTRDLLLLWQGADALHPGDGTVNVFPDELFTIAVAPHNYGSPAARMEFQNSLLDAMAAVLEGPVSPATERELASAP